MYPELGRHRARELAYAMSWVAHPDAEDVLHDAYEIAIRRGGRPTNIRLAIKQSACRFLASRARGWATLGDSVELIPDRDRSVALRVDLARALDRKDLETVLELEDGARALSRARARSLRLARRRLRSCLTAIESS
jgi:hypothetical protein